jgi:hypothetical protein
MRLAGSAYEKQEKVNLAEIDICKLEATVILPSQPQHPAKLRRRRLMRAADPKVRSMPNSSLRYFFN